MSLLAALVFTAGCRNQSSAVDGRTTEAKQFRCDDGVKNGDETDVDCGGLCPQKCGGGAACRSDVDCSTSCEQGTCKTPIVIVPPVRDVTCVCVADSNDNDGDCLLNTTEDTNKNGFYDAGDASNLSANDTDGDLIGDGCEDRNHSGTVDALDFELDPKNADTDGDGIPDGVEDANKNGLFEPERQETNGAGADTDADGFADGAEDRNHDGAWNCPENPSGPPCELNPRTIDTDGDGLTDPTELRSTTSTQLYLPGNATPDSNCTAGGNPNGRFFGQDGFLGNAVGPDGMPNTTDDILADDQTCPWQSDSDGDGLTDGLEDHDGNGRVSFGETNPRLQDSDGDGLPDGVEDANKDGLYDPMSETDAVRLDTDGDGLADGVEDSGGCAAGACPTVTPIATCNCAFYRNGAFDSNETNARVPDTDADGLRDAIEDQNGDGLCQRNVPRDPPRASDETCGYDNDSDDDTLRDGVEDGNGDGLLDPGETDPRRADPDNDCLSDNFEVFVGTDPFRPDSDGDGLADGLEASESPGIRFRYDAVAKDCVQVMCAQSYFKAACPDPNNVDTDGDGVADGFEFLGGQAIGEDRDGNGCMDPGETNPCGVPDGPNDPFPPPDVPQPPAIGGIDTTCTLPNNVACSASEVPDLYSCSCAASVPSCGTGGSCADATTCTDSSQCKQARVRAQSLVCAKGNLRPVEVIKSVDNDYSLALPAYRDARKEIRPTFENATIGFGGRPIGHVFQSKDAESATLPEPIRSVFGSVLRLANIQIGGGAVCDTVIDDPPLLDTLLPLIPSGACATSSNFVVPNSAQLPSDVAERASQRLFIVLGNAGYDVARTAGGNFDAHDDQSGTGLPTAITVQGASDRYVIRRAPGQPGTVDAYEVSRLVAEALIGVNPYLGGLSAPASFFHGPVADLRIEFFRRQVFGRRLNAMQQYETFPVAQYGAVVAVAALDADCSGLSGDARISCKLSVDKARVPVDDLTNGSALARAGATVGSGCEPFDPQKAKADFLLVVDDSGSMQDNILAITRAVKDVSVKLRANVANLDWRIALTSSTMGIDASLNPTGAALSALPDTYEPFHASYPQGTEAALASVTGNTAYFLYQHSAFNAAGIPQRCTYGDTFSDTDPTVSPYCCNIVEPDPLEFARKCCSLPQGSAQPAPYASFFALGDADLAAINAVGTYEGNDTLRCFDFPRYGQNSLPAAFLTPYSPSPAETTRHFNDYLCGSPNNNTYRKIWGARGQLWPPGFIGPDANPRRDGANLLIRNADMLVMQMNRPCAFGAFTPRSAQGSAYEHALQALKRAVQRASAGGRTTGPPDPKKLRKDTPLFSIVLSDEEDYAVKFRNNGTPTSADRDLNALPQARCVNNGDTGCSIAYCQNTCFPGLVDLPSGQFNYRIPSARDYAPGSATPSTGSDAAYCTTPFGGTATTNIKTTRRHDGMALAEAAENEDVAGPANDISGPNSVTRDVLNENNGAPLSCAAACGTDCGACMRFLREKPYIDFFSGACNAPGGAAPNANEGRRYESPAISLPGGGQIVLPNGGFYAITRRAGFQGGTAGSCGSLFPGGDGSGYRDVALASGGRVADICLAKTTTGFTDFLDEIIVEAQGIGSPYRLSGNPISATIRVGVLSRTGALRMLPRSSVSGWDYNATSRSIAFFTRGLNGSTPEALADQANQVTVQKDVKVYVSYQVWDRQCADECAVGDVCALCACTNGSPQCCTPQPTFECKPPIVTCSCGACERCDALTNSCKPTDPCGGCTMGQVCNTVLGQCQGACPAGSIPVNIPCEGASCGSVCVSQTGIPNTNGSVCAVGVPGECCGTDTNCTANNLCVLEACTGESCISHALCKALDANGNPTPDFCSPLCPTGSVCAPKPCAAQSCPPIFHCVSDSAPGQCIAGAECNCDGPCPDCQLGQICQNNQCVDLCTNNESVLECCSRANIQCCPQGQRFNPTTVACEVDIGCNPPCPADSFCDPLSGRCIPRGG
ncbi:MAG: hypothetical protein IT381_15765 [Deltaproteobacteria bacterium]|nr:hypothetical protein [Deltaproteobacteria bacterium]